MGRDDVLAAAGLETWTNSTFVELVKMPCAIGGVKERWGGRDITMM